MVWITAGCSPVKFTIDVSCLRLCSCSVPVDCQCRLAQVESYVQPELLEVVAKLSQLQSELLQVVVEESQLRYESNPVKSQIFGKGQFCIKPGCHRFTTPTPSTDTTDQLDSTRIIAFSSSFSLRNHSSSLHLACSTNLAH